MGAGEGKGRIKQVAAEGGGSRGRGEQVAGEEGESRGRGEGGRGLGEG